MKYLKFFLISGLIMSSISMNAQIKQSYYFSKILKGNFGEVSEQVKSALKEQGFGVVTEIDMHTILKEKLPDTDIKPYKIMGVCNPAFAYQTMQIEDNIGLFLPCKAVIKDIGNGEIEVLLVNPQAMMLILENEELNEIAGEVTEKFQTAINNL